MKLVHIGTTGWMLAAALLAACGGGSGGGGGAGGGNGGPGGKACSSNAQCGAGEECVLSTTSAPMDFEDDEGFGGDDGFGGSGGDDSFGGSSGDGAGGTDPGSGGSGQPGGTCKATAGSGGGGGESGSGAGGSGGGSSCSSDFITGSTFYKGDVAFGQCDDASHPKNCQFGYFILTNDGCVCTAPCNSGGLPKVGEACSTDGSWTCQTLSNSSGTYDLCTHSGLNLCTAG